jgi:hypothetical protein
MSNGISDAFIGLWEKRDPDPDDPYNRVRVVGVTLPTLVGDEGAWNPPGLVVTSAVIFGQNIEVGSDAFLADYRRIVEGNNLALQLAKIAAAEQQLARDGWAPKQSDVGSPERVFEAQARVDEAKRKGDEDLVRQAADLLQHQVDAQAKARVTA